MPAGRCCQIERRKRVDGAGRDERSAEPAFHFLDRVLQAASRDLHPHARPARGGSRTRARRSTQPIVGSAKGATRCWRASGSNSEFASVNTRMSAVDSADHGVQQGRLAGAAATCSTTRKRESGTEARRSPPSDPSTHPTRAGNQSGPRETATRAGSGSVLPERPPRCGPRRPRLTRSADPSD